ncbi:MAG: hypothetical protein LBQ31_00225 [Bacteroidales bacterium]|nr:hypothetical protein [Bacteroidales bacterium]
MKSLSLGIVRASGGCAGGRVRGGAVDELLLRLGWGVAGGRVRGGAVDGLLLPVGAWVERGVALGIEPTSFFVVGGERSVCCCW